MKLSLIIFVVLFMTYQVINGSYSLIAQQNTLQFDDYREIFLGDYKGTIFTHEWDVYNPDESDTIEGIINVSKFLGYTVQSGSNYIDIEHKIGISYAPYSADYDDSQCGWTIYYTHGFLHPTISSAGILTYPELTGCANGNLNGYCNGDSISVIYGNYNQWGGFRIIIRGKRAYSIIHDPELTEPELKVFPDPCTVELSITGVDMPADFTISDLEGNIYISGNMTGNKVNVSYLAPGLYFLRINDGVQYKTVKFIKNSNR